MPFELTEQEKLYNSLSQERMIALVDDPQAILLSCEQSSNAYGEFLFVTLDYPGWKRPLSFYGMGFHEHRERWITSWAWYETQVYGAQPKKRHTASVRATIIAAYEEALAYSKQAQERSRQAELYEMLAEMGDEDSAITDLEDFGDWLDG